MEKLGLPNTYLSGLLNTINAVTAPRKTPGNSRGDINLTPDRFNQTNADDMGRLLVMIVQCTKGQGKLIETFPAQFTPDECKMMIDLLLKNEVGTDLCERRLARRDGGAQTRLGLASIK